MVFETDQRCGRQALDLRVDNHVSNEAFLARLGFHVDKADAGEALALGGLVVVAEELVSAADGKHRRASVHRALERRLFVLEEVFVHQCLLPVLAASKEEDVDVLHALGVAAAELQKFGVVTAPLGALEQREDIAPVAIDVHEVGIQPTDSECLLAACHLVVPRVSYVSQ